MSNNVQKLRSETVHRREVQSLPQTVPRSKTMCPHLTKHISKGLADTFRVGCSKPLYLLGLMAVSVMLQLRRAFHRSKRTKIFVRVYRNHERHGVTSYRLPVHTLPSHAPTCIERLDSLLPHLCSDQVLGLDCEWQPESAANKHNRISVIQICSSTLCVIHRPLHSFSSIPSSLSSNPAEGPQDASEPLQETGLVRCLGCQYHDQHLSLDPTPQPFISPQSAHFHTSDSNESMDRGGTLEQRVNNPSAICANNHGSQGEGAVCTDSHGSQGGGAVCTDNHGSQGEGAVCTDNHSSQGEGAVCTDNHGSQGEGVRHENDSKQQQQQGGFIPPALISILEDPTIIKAGVGIYEDVRRLRRDFGISVKGALDLRTPLLQFAPQYLASGGSLQALVQQMLGVHLDKSCQCSSWQDLVLTQKQLEYAARDSWYSREIAVTLHRIATAESASSTPCITSHISASPSSILHHKTPLLVTSTRAIPPVNKHLNSTRAIPSVSKQLNSTRAIPPVSKQLNSEPASKVVNLKPAVIEAQAPEASGEMQSVDTGVANTTSSEFSRVFQAFLDLPQGSTSTRLPSGSMSPGCQLTSTANGQMPALAKKLNPNSIPTRKSELYENCRLLAPDGNVLCTCGLKKLSWYLDRGLAVLICDSPMTAQLKFEPRGRGHAGDEYYLSDKENRCCVCGKYGEYLRHNIIPHCYRSHFPLNMKSHLSHDIVLLCQDCKQVCNKADQARMEALGQQCSAPPRQQNDKFDLDFQAVSVKCAARALMATKAAEIPPNRKAQLAGIIMAHYGASSVTTDLLAQAAQLEPKRLNHEWRSIAALIVENMNIVQLEAFVRGWRQHFLDVMKPRFLSPYWSVNSRVTNSSKSDN
ncbi:hypothetical protein CEUSTIGMA_g3161.t1 [Chlamydomonas eustigma]|uniref:3'-5' exonuclease domain-containing protein n=1 Tax=Chlamydomonas eustigma TaxID=1157962 RepID=A0A250WXZ1_9CHLO|nr:hypothetical protein CEUSTIGMA_g3161.t1 [Chlamydomonas eustigma]|eukprot:GAX75718.1 hypothetical protein CEUSTIGMA_g3161.t1 [Chlamydomonas eustigma]